MMKKAACLLLILALSLPLCGCWNNFDLDSLAIVVGVGFDRADDGRMQVTAEVLSPNPDQENQSGGSGGKRGSLVYTVEGATFFEAIRNFIAKTGKRLYWQDVQLVVVGEDYAKEGVTDLLDYFQRDQQANLKSDLIIAKGMTAQEVLKAQPNIDQTAAAQINNSLVGTVTSGETVKAMLFDIVRQNSALKPCIVVGAIEKDKAESDAAESPDSKDSPELMGMVVKGSAILKNFKLAGYLSPEETRGFLFADDKIQSTIISVENPVEKNKLVSIKLTEASGKIKADIVENKPKLTVEIEAKGAVGDQQGGGDLTAPEHIGALTAAVENEIRKEIASAASVSQKESGSDIFCFSEDIYQNDYNKWREMAQNWDDVYAQSDIGIRVNFLIKRPGMITEPVEKKE